MKKLLLLYFSAIPLLLFSQQQIKTKFYIENKNREIHLFADNEEWAPVSSKFAFNLQNLSSSLANHQIIVIPAKTKKFPVAKLVPIKLKDATKFSYSNYFSIGNVLQEKYDKDYIYDLPFETGKTQLIYQGYHGKFSHTNEYALDFDLKIGDQIFAAREGIVVQVIDNFNQNCANSSCAKYNNKIIIMHNDGTFADYAHLKWNGSAVKEGDLVKKGQLIGYSGNTGFSNGPHLHFSVFINRIDGSRTFIPTKFRTLKKEATILLEGKSYTKNY